MGTPKSAKNRGKKPLWDDLFESHGSVSMPSTPMASRTQFTRELGLGGQDGNESKQSVISKVQNKVKKWKITSPPYYKMKFGKSLKGSKLGSESSESMASVKDDEEHEEENPEFHGAPMYESERAPDLYNDRITDLETLMRSNSPQLGRCKSQRPRPGFKSEIEKICDMNRTKSDPVQLQTTKSQIEEICNINMQRTISEPLRLNPNNNGSNLNSNNNDSNPEQYKMMIEEINEILEPKMDDSTQMVTKPKPKPTRFNPINFSRQLECSQSDKTGTSNPVFDKYGILNPVLSNKIGTSNPVSDKTDISNPVLSVKTGASNPTSDKTGTSNLVSNEIGTSNSVIDKTGTSNEFVMRTESPTAKVLSEAALMIAGSIQVETKPEACQLNQTSNNSHKNVTEKLISTKFLDDSMNSTNNEMANPGENKTVSEAVSEILTPAFNVVPEATDNSVEVNEDLKKDEVQKPESATLNSNISLQKPESATLNSNISLVWTTFEDSTDLDNYKTENVVPELTDKMVEVNETLKRDELQKTDSDLLDLNKSSMKFEDSSDLDNNKTKHVGLNEIFFPASDDTLNSEIVSTNVVDQITDHDSNSSNLNKTETEAVMETSNKTEPAESESKVVSPKESDNNLNNKNGAENDADYKTVIDAVGEIMTPVYSRISNVTNKVAIAGYSKGLSIREYLKNTRVVDQVRGRVSSLMRQDDLPVSSNPHAEEEKEAVERSDDKGRRLQAN